MGTLNGSKVTKYCSFEFSIHHGILKKMCDGFHKSIKQFST